MNLLIDELPNAVEIAGVEWEIRTDFRNCLRTILAFESDELTVDEKVMVMLRNLYPVIPPDESAAADQALKFLNGGKEGEEEQGVPLRLYAFEKDANYIFAAFRQTHGIDLETEQLHWWKFLALFMDLGADTTFCNLVALRKRLKTGRATKEEEKEAREIADILDLDEPDTRSAEDLEKEEEFMRLVRGAH